MTQPAIRTKAPFRIFDNSFADGEPQPRAMRLAECDKGMEQFLDHFRGDARALILNLRDHLISCLLKSHGDLAALGHHLHGVSGKIENHAANSPWIKLQHARERTGIFVAVLEKNIDDFNVATWQPQIEGGKTGRELPAIVDQIVTMQSIDFGDRKPVRAFVCTNPNPWGYPAKDRSGRLDQLEPPNLGGLIEKLTGPGQRKPFTVVSPKQSAQT